MSNTVVNILDILGGRDAILLAIELELIELGYKSVKIKEFTNILEMRVSETIPDENSQPLFLSVIRKYANNLGLVHIDYGSYRSRDKDKPWYHWCILEPLVLSPSRRGAYTRGSLHE